MSAWRTSVPSVSGETNQTLLSVTGNISEARLVAASVDLSTCPPITMAQLLLERVSARVHTFEVNRHEMKLAGGNLSLFAALDGSNHTRFLEFWRASGFRLLKRGGGWMSSYGAISATLTHLNALRWQWSSRIPFFLRVEDDVHIRTPLLVRQLCCYLTRYLETGADHRGAGSSATLIRPSEQRLSAMHFNLGGPGSPNIGSEIYLTSLEGARNELRRLCESGIYNGVDYMFNLHQPQTFHVTSALSKLLFLRKVAPGSRKGSVTNQMSHFNLTALASESSSWPRDACLQWAGIS